MDDVRVYYKSSKPATFLTHEYTQGTDIQLAPGLENKLMHEACHFALKCFFNRDIKYGKKLTDKR